MERTPIGGTAALTLDSDVLSGNQAVGDANGNAVGGAVYNVRRGQPDHRQHVVCEQPDQRHE